MTQSAAAIVQITGSPLAAEVSPNTTAPAAGRVFYAPTGSAMPVPLLALFTTDGTSATVSLWMYEEQTGVWVALQTGILVAVLAAAYTPAIIPPRAKLFLQITAVAGAPTKLAGFFL